MPKVTKTLHDAATEAAIGNTIFDPEYKLTDWRHEEVTLAVQSTEAPTVSIQPQQSMDGNLWYNVGAPITDIASITKLTVFAPYFRADITELEPGEPPGTVSVYAA